MELILYRTNDNPNVVNKVLLEPVSIDIVLKNDVNIINPEIILSGDYRGYNYAHIPDLKRYYFIDSFEQLNLRFGKLYMSCDLLETYKNSFINEVATLIREAKEGDNLNINAETNTNIINTYQSNIELERVNSITLTTVSK